jgi:hypothetical protein
MEEHEEGSLGQSLAAEVTATVLVGLAALYVEYEKMTGKSWTEALEGDDS